MNQNPYMNPYPTMRPYGNTINWVQGVEGAKAFQIAPNSNVMMLDSENDGIFYIKTSDNVGMCSMRTFKFEEITTTSSSAPPDLSDYVRKDELQELIEKLIKPEVKNEQSVSTTTRRIINA